MSHAEMNDEFERYQRLLNDWNQGKSQGGSRPTHPRVPGRSAPPPSPSIPRAGGRPRARLRAQAEEEPEGRHPKGTILVLDDEEMVVYRRPMAGEPYDMVYSLLADGKVRIEAVQMEDHQVGVLGLLPEVDLKRLQSAMTWTRALIAERCTKPEDRDRIPEPAVDGTESAPPKSSSPPPRSSPATPPPKVEREAAPEPEASSAPHKTTIRRGQRVRLKFGDRSWDAVYWGKDNVGTVVAHNTHNQWTLMHLDLNRFKESMVVDPQPDDKLIQSIRESLNTAQREAKYE